MSYKLIRIALLLSLLAEQSAPARDATNATPPAISGTNQVKAPTFEVRRYDVRGNTLLRQEVIDHIFTNVIGPAITMEQIRKALGELQLAYRERGFITVALNVPQQQLTNAVVRIDVTEAPLVDIRVKGNRFFSSNNVMRDLPSLRTNILLNSRIFQRELDEANLNRDRQIYPAIEPGPDPGTSALVLKVKDRFPLHGRFDIDNYATPGTPELRINVALQYNNLWQENHQVGISYGFTPQQNKAEDLMSDYLFDEPMISYYGAYYRIPFGPSSVEEEINQSSSFGYNEASHQFVLPPSGGRPDLTFYASASASDTGVKYGDLQQVVTNSLETITSQTSGRNLGINENLGGRLTCPVYNGEHEHWSLFGGVDWKHYSLTIFSTNTDTTLVDSNPGTAPIPPAINASSSPVQYNQVNYFPINAGVDFSETDSKGSSSANFTATYNSTGGRTNFASLAYSPHARERFGKFNLSLSREEKLPGDWSLLLRGSAQGATCPLISNEQFPVGGISSVRGYYEGDDYGDAGWFGSLEARTPLWSTHAASINKSVPAWLQASIFMDYGQLYLLDASPGTSSARSLWGTGFGFSANINNHVEARVAVAWPILSSANTGAGIPGAYFTLGAQF